VSEILGETAWYVLSVFVLVVCAAIWRTDR
jgi:hypothetical protein